MDSLFILLLIVCVMGLELCKFCVFNGGIIVYNDCFEMKYELECEYYCDILLSMKIDAPTATSASTMHLNQIGNRSYQISRIGCNAFGVSSPTTTKTAISITNENEMKYEGGLLVPQAQIQIQIQSQHATPHLAEKPFHFNPNGAGPHEFNHLEYIFDRILSEDSDANNVCKYWCNETFNGNYDCNTYYESHGMSAFDVFDFYFSSCTCSKYTSCCI